MNGVVVKRMMAGLLIVTLALAGCGKKQEAAAPPPVVEVMTVGQKNAPLYQEWVGVLDGSVNAVIKPQVSGYLIRQNYREGDPVKAGQALFEIDPRTFKAAVDRAQGALDEATANLARAEATYAVARADLARVKPLAAKNAVSQKDLDDAVGKELSGRAAVESYKAAIATAAANLETARLDLGFTKISSPVSGVAGIAKAQLGNLVGPSMQTELTTVSTIDPIKVYVNVSEQEYIQARGAGDRPETMELELILADGSMYPFKGKFALADRQVDETTGTLKVGSLFPNPKQFLRPGQYGKVRARMANKPGTLLVPQRAVTEIQGNYQVAVVGSDNKVDIRQVTVGEWVGNDWIIETGLKPGEQVVVEGTQKVRPGMGVQPKPFTPVAPAARPAPPAAGKKG